MRKDSLARKCDSCSHYSWDAGYNDGEHSWGGCANANSPNYHVPFWELQKREIKDCSFYRRKENCKIKTIVVTGASRGIGKAIAEEFSREYDMAIISRNYAELEKVTDALVEYSSKLCVPFQCDISNPSQVQEIFEKIYKEFGSIDVLVNNAGINSRKTLKPENLENWFDKFGDNLKGWDEEIATNLTGAYICSYLASGYMLRRENGGVIINISSVKGKEPTSSPGYGASKAGIIKLTRDFAKSLAPKIRVNCICPGFIDTGMTAELPEEKKQDYKKMVPMKRFGKVEEIAKAVAFLASENSSYITGAIIDVNGGYLMD